MLCGTGNLILAALCLGLLLSARPLQAQSSSPDSSAAEQQNLPPGHSPAGALRRAALPGWGQIYNRQYYKLPFVYLGLGGLVGTAVYAARQYRLHAHAYWFAEPQLRDENDAPQYPQYEEDYARLLRQWDLPPDTELTEEEARARRTRLAPQIKQQRYFFLRNRDLLIIGSGLYYALTVLDAYVSAHLLAFDVSDDLTMSVRPHPARLGFRATLKLDP